MLVIAITQQPSTALVPATRLIPQKYTSNLDLFMYFFYKVIRIKSLVYFGSMIFDKQHDDRGDG